MSRAPRAGTVFYGDTVICRRRSVGVKVELHSTGGIVIVGGCGVTVDDVRCLVETRVDARLPFGLVSLFGA